MFEKIKSKIFINGTMSIIFSGETIRTFKIYKLWPKFVLRSTVNRHRESIAQALLKCISDYVTDIDRLSEINALFKKDSILRAANVTIKPYEIDYSVGKTIRYKILYHIYADGEIIDEICDLAVILIIDI